MHRKDITLALRDRGRDDGIEAVSAALAYMNRDPNPRVRGVGAGIWSLIETAAVPHDREESG
jgi:hypothetical protein